MKARTSNDALEGTMTESTITPHDVRRVLAAHFQLLTDHGDDAWPPISPSDALRDVEIGEHSIAEHVDEIVATLRGCHG